MVVPPKHPKMIIFSRKTHGCWVPPFLETPIYRFIGGFRLSITWFHAFFSKSFNCSTDHTFGQKMDHPNPKQVVCFSKNGCTVGLSPERHTKKKGLIQLILLRSMIDFLLTFLLDE